MLQKVLTVMNTLYEEVLIFTDSIQLRLNLQHCLAFVALVAWEYGTVSTEN